MRFRYEVDILLRRCSLREKVVETLEGSIPEHNARERRQNAALIQRNVNLISVKQIVLVNQRERTGQLVYIWHRKNAPRSEGLPRTRARTRNSRTQSGFMKARGNVPYKKQT